MATLTGTTIQSTYDSLLKVTDNDSITGSLKRITDGLGNNTPLYLSSSAVEIVSTLNVTSTITGSNLSGTNTGDETKASIETKLGAATSSNSGYLTSADWSTFSNKIAGSGTLNTIPKFSSSSSIGNSNITDTGSLITLGSNTYVNGSIGLGTSTLGSYIIRIVSNLTGGTSSYSISNAPVIQSDVTTSARIFRTAPSTQATAFTLTNLYHYLAEQGTIGAGSIVTTQIGFLAANTLIGATNNYGFQGAIPAGLNNYNLYMSGVAGNYLAGDVGIGVSAGVVSSGPILTTTLTSGGSGYVDGTYTDVASTVITGTGAYSLYTVVVSGGIVTSATLTWGGSSYKVGETITVSNTLLGGTGSGLIITVATVDSSRLKIANGSGGDITLYRADSSVLVGDNIGSIKFEGNDASTKASGIHAKISAFGAAAAGGAYLSFFTRSTVAGTSLVEAMRIGSEGGVGIGATAVTQFGLRVAKNITGSTSSVGVYSDGQIQSGVTVRAEYFGSAASTAATTFTLATLSHFRATQGTFGAGSTVTTQVGFDVTSALIGATNNYGFRGQIASGTGRWNLYMDGTASNYLEGTTLIGSTFDIASNYKLQVTGDIYTSGSIAIGSVSSISTKLFGIGRAITGATTAYGITFEGNIESTVTTNGIVYRSYPIVTGGTLGAITHYIASKNAFIGGSTITNQYGFFADASVSGATNNYGFYGNIASATGAWNLYMNGTAQNYINGNLGIGVAVPTVKLDVSGAGLFSSSVTASSFIKSGGTSAQLLAGDGSVVTAGTNITISGGTISSSGGLSGSGTTNYVPKFTGSSAIGNSLIFDNGTNVGIGTTSPNAKLTVASTDVPVASFYRDLDVLSVGPAGQYFDIGARKGATFTPAIRIAGVLQSNGDDGFLQVSTLSGGLVFERMRITSGGNVGIGTTSPSSKFHVWNGGIKTTGFPSAGNPFNFLESNYNDSAVTVRFQNINPTNGYDADLGIQLMNTSASIVDVLRIKGSTGNVGIGTTSPSNKLTVQSDDAFNQDTSGQIVIKGSTTTTKNLRIGFDTGNNYGYVQAINTGISTQPFVMQPFGGNVGIGTTSPASKLNVSGDNITVSAGYGIAWAGDQTRIMTPEDNVSGALIRYGSGGIVRFVNGSTEHMRITSTGNVGIGTSTPGDILVLSRAGGGATRIKLEASFGNNYIGYDGATSGMQLATQGELLFQTGSGYTEKARITSDGRFQVNNTGYSANCTATLRALSSTGTDRILECITIGYSSAFYVQTNGSYFFAGSNLSDARTKKDINYLEESILDKVMKLKPASFRYKENEENIKGGFIAQDIKEIFPDLVTATKSDDEMMGVDYYGVIAILTKAIQEQQIQIEELKAKLK
jgi:hypothetical protein